MSLDIFNGLTSQTVDLFILDSSSTTGAGKTGLVYNTSGLAICYRKGATGTATAITLATQTVGGAWSSGGFVEVDSTNMPGLYRLDLPNAAVDTSGFVTIYVKGTGIAVAPTRVDCRPVNTVTSVTGAVGSVTGAVGSVTGNLGGNVNGNVAGTVGSVTGAVGSVTGSVGSVAGSVVGSVASVAGAVGSVSGGVGGDVSGKVLGGGSGTISGDGVRASSVTGAVGSVTGSVGSVVGLVSLLGTPAGASISADIAAIKAETLTAMRAAVVIIGTISNAGTAVEAYTYGGVTATFSGLDTSGNRSGVVFS